MRHSLRFVLLLALGVMDASAERYWIAYEGNDFPENVGWNRNYGNWDGQWHGGANRSIQDGILTIDSLYDTGVFDFAWIEMPGQIDPDPGELFVMEWRLKIDAVDGRVDPDVALGSDSGGRVGFEYDADTLFSAFESGVEYSFTPGIFHDYRLLSSDMQTYALYVDTHLALEGTFWNGITESYVGWGDGVQGGASLSHWDYYRFGVLPEPSAGGLLLLGLASRRIRR